LAAVYVFQMLALRSRRVSPGIEASRRAWIPSLPVEPPVLVLWLNQENRRFCGEPPQTPCAHCGHKPVPCIGSCPRLRLTFLATMRSAGSIEPSVLVSPLLGGPARLRPFVRALHLYQRQSCRNLNLQFSAKSQSTPHCQPLITPGSDHPPVL
jgi:hypothetical protein